MSTTTPVRHCTLATGQNATLAATDGHEGLPEVAMPVEALVRLVYGRLDPAHTPPIETRRADLDELRQLFPGFDERSDSERTLQPLAETGATSDQQASNGKDT